MRRRQAHHRMEAHMAPPHKRRRLTESASQPSPAYTQLAPPEPSPTLSHTVEELGQNPTLALLPRPIPQRIDEVHLQIQRRSIAEHHEHHHQRRQGTAVSSALDSTLTVTVLEWADITGGIALSTINDDLGGTYATTQTLTLVSSPLPSATTTSSSAQETSTSNESLESEPSSSPSEGFIDSSPSGTGSGTGVSSTGASQTGTGSTTSTSASASGVSAANISSSNSTRTDTTRSPGTSALSSSRASLGAGVFLATLSDGDVVTITRSDEPFTTTFADGRVSTIAPSSIRNSNDDDSSGRTTRTSDDDSSDSQQSTQQQSTATSVNFVPGPNATQQSPATPTADSISSTSSAAGGGGGGSGTTAPPATIAGGVVGGCAGLAVILVVALVLLRWWKRKAQNGHHALPPSSEFTPDPEISSSLRGQPGMAERAGLRPLVGAVPAFLRHTNRSSAPSAPSTERGFTRVSGRKLPSQFSAGMSSSSPPPPDMPLAAPGARSPDPNDHERNLSATSFYRDSDGFYGGEGTPANIAAAYAPTTRHQNRNRDAAAGPFEGPSPSPSESLENPRGPTPEGDVNMTLSPGPRRTPTVHRGGPYTMSPSSTVPSTPAMPLSPAQPSSGVGSPLIGGAFPRDGYARSETPTSSSVVDERGSRFTEEV